MEWILSDNADHLDTKDAIANVVNLLLAIPDGKDTAPFIWRTWENGKKKGMFQSELILNIFAVAHLTLFDKALDSIAGDDKPVGALLLAMQAAQRGLLFWKTGEFIDDKTSTGYFSFDNYGDKTAQDKKTKEMVTTRHATKLLPSVKAFNDDRWRQLLTAAMEYLEPKKTKAGSTTSSRPTSEIFTKDDFIIKSDPDSDDSGA
ncbi:hypothetical protein DXG01_013567 [Tephrocybe rancida]|nr:hypothetical protein DXG01_013567 [Tephrocybe rancida]